MDTPLLQLTAMPAVYICRIYLGHCLLKLLLGCTAAQVLRDALLVWMTCPARLDPAVMGKKVDFPVDLVPAFNAVAQQVGLTGPQSPFLLIDTYRMTQGELPGGGTCNRLARHSCM